MLASQTHFLSRLDVTSSPCTDLKLLIAITNGLILAHLEVGVAAVVDEASVIAEFTLDV